MEIINSPITDFNFLTVTELDVCLVYANTPKRTASQMTFMISIVTEK